MIARLKRKSVMTG